MSKSTSISQEVGDQSRGDGIAESMLTRKDGRLLAVKLLEDFDGWEVPEGEDGVGGAFPWSILARYRPVDSSQENVVLRYLDRLMAGGSREALEGFCSVITDHIGQGIAGPGAMFPRVYEAATDAQIDGAFGSWPAFCDIDGGDESVDFVDLKGVPMSGVSHE